MELRAPTRAARVGRAFRSAVVATLVWVAAGALGIDNVAGFPAIDWLILPLAAGAVLGWLGLTNLVRMFAGLVVVLLCAVAWVPLFGAMARSSIREDPLPRDSVDAIMVLSASVTADGDLNPSGADRLWSGFHLYRQGYAHRLIVSRVVNPLGRKRRSDEDQTRLMGVAGLTPEVHIVDSTHTTRGEAVRAKALADQHGWRRIIVVTSPIHTRRACATFERVGFEVSCQPSRDRTAAVFLQLSAQDRVRAFGQWLYETLGWWEYRLRGWV